MTKLYTKTGDKGETSLVSGERVAKDEARLHAYGTVDELNAHVGLLRDRIATSGLSDAEPLDGMLLAVQNELFDLGSELATPAEAFARFKIKGIAPDSATRLEQEMDAWTATLKPLHNFVLPGGHELNAQAHVCRTVTRRAERCVVTVLKDDPAMRQEGLIYLNRLSDWFFTLSRWLSQQLGAPEVLWGRKLRH